MPFGPGIFYGFMLFFVVQLFLLLACFLFLNLLNYLKYYSLKMRHRRCRAHLTAALKLRCHFRQARCKVRHLQRRRAAFACRRGVVCRRLSPGLSVQQALLRCVVLSVEPHLSLTGMARQHESS